MSPLAVNTLTLLLAAGIAHAQPASNEVLRPVEAGVADVGPLGLSFRRLQLDMRKPIGFDRVFEFSAPTATAAGKFARVSGALTAIFPRSQYGATEEGQVLAVIPADTRFMIGSNSSSPAVAPNAPAASATTHAHTVLNAAATGSDNRVDRRATRATSASGDPAASQPMADHEDPLSSGQTGMLVSETYRVRRIGTLLSDALNAGARDHSASPD